MVSTGVLYTLKKGSIPFPTTQMVLNPGSFLNIKLWAKSSNRKLERVPPLLADRCGQQSFKLRGRDRYS